MWRSIVIARRSSSRDAGPNLWKLLSLQNPPQPPQVFNFHTLTFLQSPSNLHPRVRRNLRFFSNDSLASAHNDVEESHSESSISGTNDGNSVADDDVVSTPVSSHSEELGLVFDETRDIQMAGDDVFASVEDQSVEEDEVYEIDLDQLESVLSLLQSSNGTVDDVSLESTLENMSLTLHEDFIVRVLETPLVPGGNLIQFFKWSLNKPEISVTNRTVLALVRAISSGLKKKEAYALWDLVKELGEKENQVLTNETLNELISLFSRLGKGKAGYEVFNKFGDFGCVPDADSYYFTVEALCKRSIYDWACSVSEKMLNAGMLPDSAKVGAIISYLCKGSRAKDAHLVYLLAKENDKYPPQASISYLISSLCREDDTVQLALEMLDVFSADERKYAIKPFSSVVSGLCRIKDVEGAKKLLLKMIDEGPIPGNAVFNSVVNGLAKEGEMEEAMKVMKVMENRGLKPDVYTYSVIMSGYVRGGEMEAACKVLDEAKKKHSKLSPVTYHTLIRGYCKLEQFDKALELLSEMKEFGVRPTADEYNKLIQSLCLKALDWETAEKLLEEMKENGLFLNGITKGLIRAVKEIEEEDGKSEEEVVVEA